MCRGWGGRRARLALGVAGLDARRLPLHRPLPASMSPAFAHQDLSQARGAGLGTVWRWASSDPSPSMALRTRKEAAAAAHGVQQRTVTRARGTLRKQPVPELPGPRGPGGQAQPGGVQSAGQIPLPVHTAIPGPAPTLAVTTCRIRGPAFRPSEVQGARAWSWVTQEARALLGSGCQGLWEPRGPLWQTPLLALELLSDQGRPLPPSSGLLEAS